VDDNKRLAIQEYRKNLYRKIIQRKKVDTHVCSLSVFCPHLSRALLSIFRAFSHVPSRSLMHTMLSLQLSHAHNALAP
jgi:hypothetical protein